MRILLIAFVAISLSACASFQTQIMGVDEPNLVNDIVYVEPVSEVAELQTRSQAIPAGNVTVYQTWQEKPFLAKPETRRKIHRELLREAGENYRSTDEMADNGEDVLVTRITILDHITTKSTESLQAIACGFGFLCPPLWIYNFFPVQYEDEIVVSAQTFVIPASEVKSRLINMPGVQGMVNTNGLIPLSSRELSATMNSSRGFLNFATHDQEFIDGAMPVFLDALSGAARRERPPAADAPPNSALEY